MLFYAKVTGPIFIIHLRDVEALVLQFLNRNCHIPTGFGTPAWQINIILPILPKIGCQCNVPWEIEKKVQIDHLQTNTYHLVKKDRLVNL